MSDKNDKPSKYRDEDISPTTLLRLNQLDRNIVVNRISSLLESEDDQLRKTGILISFSYTFNCTLNEALGFDLKNKFTKDFNYYKLNIPLGAQQWRPNRSEDERLFEPVIETIDLPLPSKLANALSKTAGHYSTERSLSGNFGVNNSLIKKAKKEIGNLRANRSSHITTARIAAAVKSELYVRFQNPTLVYLLANKTHLDPPHTRYYYVPSDHQVLEAWGHLLGVLWGSPPPLQMDLLKRRFWNGYVLKGSSIRLFISKIQKRPNPKHLVAFHNWYALYTVAMLSWNLGHRAVKDPFCEEGFVDLESGLILLNDKRKHGSNNFRMLPLPQLLKKQYENYLVHLSNLAKIIEYQRPSPDLNNLRFYIKKLISPTPKGLKQRRLFFLLDEDGKLLMPITPNVIERWISDNGLPVKANFGRHHVATKLIASHNCSYPETQLFLGHSMKQKTGLTSELALTQNLEKIRAGIDAIASQDGWKPILGVQRPKNCPELSFARVASPDSSFFPAEEPGYMLRAKYQKKQKYLIKISTKNIKDYLDGITRTDNKHITKSSALEQKLKDEMAGLDFPYHVDWKTLMGYIRDEFDGKNPLPNVLKFNNLSSGISSLTSQSVSKYKKTQNAISQWINWLNSDWCEWIEYHNSDYARSVKLRATLIVNSSLIGGAQREEVTLALANKEYDHEVFYHKIYTTCGVTHVECYKKEKYEVDKEEYWEPRWIDRWIPDAFSKAILFHLQDLPSANDKAIEIAIGFIRNTLELPYGLSGTFKSLAKIRRPISVLDSSGFINALQSGKLHRRPLSIEAWARQLTGRQWMLEAENEAIIEQLEEMPLVISEDNYRLKVLKRRIHREISRCIKTRAPNRKQQCIRIRSVLLRTQQQQSEAPLPILMFLSWAMQLCDRGTKGFSKKGKLKLKDTTIRSYISRLFSALFIGQDFPYFESMTGEEITEFYKKVINDNTGKTTTHNLRQLIYMFQTNSQLEYSIEECDWEELDGIPIKYTPSNKGNIVTKREYKLLIESLVKKLEGHYLEAMNCLFVAIMMYRFGLRPSETIRLMPRDLLFDDSGNIQAVLVRKSSLGSTKTKKGVRQTPCAFELTKPERVILRNAYERGLAYSELNSEFAITSPSLVSDTQYRLSKRNSKLSQLLSEKLKHITGDPEVSAYSLRHAYTSIQVASFLNPEEPQKTLQNLYERSKPEVFNESGAYNSPLKSLSKSLGHKSPSTTLRTYTHSLEVIDAPDNAALEKIGDHVFAFALKKNKGTFQTQKSRLKTNEKVVDSYYAKVKNPSLQDETRKYRPRKNTNLKNIKFFEPTLLQVLDFAVINSRNKSWPSSFTENQHAFRVINKANVLTNFLTPSVNVLSLFSTAKSAQVKRAVYWIQHNNDFLIELVKINRRRSKLVKQLSLFRDCLVPASGNWVVLNGNEITSLKSMLARFRIEAIISRRISNRKIVAQKKAPLVKYKNYAANAKHKDPLRKHSGYELTLKLGEEFKNLKSLNLALSVIYLYLVAS